MKNQIFFLTIFCLISNATCLMAANRLDEISECALLRYALRQSAKDGYWPQGAVVTLESFKKVGDEYEARFVGRWDRPVIFVSGNIAVPATCRYRSAFISVATLTKIGVRLPK